MSRESDVDAARIRHDQGSVLTNPSKADELTHQRAPLVSVIIPSRNSKLTVGDCLRSIISQSYKPIEIILVDCCSTDSTREIAQRMGAFVISLDGERSVAKNLGAEVANGEYLFFVDADHELDSHVVATCVKTIDGVDGVLIKDQDVSAQSKVSRLIASRRKILSADPMNVAVRFIRREAFDRIGGFDPNLYADEDVDFHRRFLKLGFKMVSGQVTEWHLGSPVDLKGFINRSLYYSSNHLKYAHRNPVIAFSRINPFRVVANWKRSDVSGSDLLPIVLMGFLSNVFLIIGAFLNRNMREGSRKDVHDS